MDAVEHRSVQGIEVREDEKGTVISGYALKWTERAEIYGFFETFERGAFAATIKRDDVRLLANHYGLAMARSERGTLRLREDDKGLALEAELNPDDPEARGVLAKIKRGDVDGLSVGFSMRGGEEKWDKPAKQRELPTRTITRVGELKEVSVVSFPAYTSSDVGMKRYQAFCAAHDASDGAIAAALTRMRARARLRGIITSRDMARSQT